MARAAIIEMCPGPHPIDSQTYHFKVVARSGPDMAGIGGSGYTIAVRAASLGCDSRPKFGGPTIESVPQQVRF